MTSRRRGSVVLAAGSLALVAAAIGCAREHRSPGADAAASSPPASPRGAPWTFAVISDLHIPRDGHVTARLRDAIDAVIASHPRFVVITGDFTDGNLFDPTWRQHEAPRWWHGVVEVLSPLRAAGIPILPIAGNHDSYLPAYRVDYAATFRDLDAWAYPLQIRGKHQPPFSLELDAAPFSYSVDVDDVHLTLADVVDQSLDPSVAHWIAHDLEAAAHAKLRIVFGHVPLASVAAHPSAGFLATFGRILATGHADLYVAGHEHLAWDEDVELPGGARIEQVIVGTAAAWWRFGPGVTARAQAACAETDRLACCTMPRGGIPFELQRQHAIWYQAQPHSFTLFTIEGTHVGVRVIALRDDGTTEPFGPAEACRSRATSASRRRAIGPRG